MITKTVRTWRNEFPDYDDQLKFLPGFIDTSWHNDTCPSIGLELDEKHGDWIRVFQDYKDPEKREYQECWRYGITVSGELFGGSISIFETNNWKEIENHLDWKDIPKTYKIMKKLLNRENWK